MQVNTQFNGSSPLKIGVEVELQLLDENTFDLKPTSVEILAKTQAYTDRIEAEIFQSMIEVKTGICENANQAANEIKNTVNYLLPIARQQGVHLAAAGSHPFACHKERLLYPAKRYSKLIDRNQWIARRLMIFGLHVHIGVESGDHAIHLSNGLLQYLPLFLGYSASSPFYNNEETGLASSRITFFEALPTGGHPCTFSNWKEFEVFVERLVSSKTITHLKDIWWDIRPNVELGTVEVRICDMPTTIQEIEELVALIHICATKIYNDYQNGKKFEPLDQWLIRENKWRASRHGQSALFVNTNDFSTISFNDYLADLFNAHSFEIKTHNYSWLESRVQNRLKSGLPYERQIRQFNGHFTDAAKFNSIEFENSLKN